MVVAYGGRRPKGKKTGCRPGGGRAGLERQIHCGRGKKYDQLFVSTSFFLGVEIIKIHLVSAIRFRTSGGWHLAASSKLLDLNCSFGFSLNCSFATDLKTS
jgi:hypothetical protein